MKLHLNWNQRIQNNLFHLKRGHIQENSQMFMNHGHN